MSSQGHGPGTAKQGIDITATLGKHKPMMVSLVLLGRKKCTHQRMPPPAGRN